MASITAAVATVKKDLPGQIDPALIEQACTAAGYERGQLHGWRDRVLTPAVTVRLFVLQVLWGNVACRVVTHLSERTFTAAAYCAARMRLPTDVLGAIAAALTQEARQQTAGFGRWLGHRVFHIDGTGVSMPDTPALQKAFGQPGRQKRGCGFPVMHVLWLFDASTGLVADFITSRWNTHDMAHAAGLHASMEDGDVLVGDRAFASFAHLALLLQADLHGLLMAHQRRIVSFRRGRKARHQHRKSQCQGAPTSRWLRGLGARDQLVEYRKPARRPKWISASQYDQLPPTITVRELHYRIDRPGFRTQQATLVATLLDPRKYAAAELARLYGIRWRIETNLKHLKQTMSMDVLRSKTVEGVRKELWAYLIVYNQVRQFMLDAAQRQGVPPDRISFIDALDALRHRGPTDAARCSLTVNPHRPGRHEPRVIKRRKDRYTYMTRPRDQLRQALGITTVAA